MLGKYILTWKNFTTPGFYLILKKKKNRTRVLNAINNILIMELMNVLKDIENDNQISGFSI